jgi:hypothetical protein
MRGEKPHFRIKTTRFDHTFPYRNEVRRTITEPTESKIGMLSRLPKRTLFVVVGIFVLAFAYYFYSITPTPQPQNAALAAIVGVLLVLIPTVPYVRGPAMEKKWEED